MSMRNALMNLATFKQNGTYLSLNRLNSMLCLALLISLASLSAAQSGVGVSPPRVELLSISGDSLNQEILIDNPSSSTALDVLVTPTDVLIQPNGELIYLEAGSHPNSIAPWLSLSEFQFELGPQASTTVTYSIDVPEDAAEGTYWGVLFFESDVANQDDTNAGFNIRSRVRIGHVVYVDVGQVSREGQVEGIRYSPEGIRVSLRNSGTGLIRASGSVEIRSEEGELVQSLELPSNAVLPNYASESIATYSEELESGSYVVLAVLDYGEGVLAAGEGRIEVP